MSGNGFQSRVQNQPGVATRGDFADANLRANVIAGEGALISNDAPRSPIVGNFAWGDQATGLASGRYFGEASARVGFVHRENNALITAFLGSDVLAIAPGQIMTLFNQGGFWAHFVAAAAVGQKVFANYLDGSCYAADAGTSTQTGAVTASLASTGILTVSAVGSGAVSVGDVVSGTGVVACSILAQLSGTPGDVGTYQTSQLATLTSRAMTLHGSVETDFVVESPVVPSSTITASLSALGVLTVTGAGAQALEVGDLLAATGLSPGARITAFISGTGGTGTYQTNMIQGPALTSRTFAATQGQLAKISTWG